MGRVYAVVSAKGGVGKTTTAANVAASLAAAGSDVVAVDADLGMANLAGSLGIVVGDVTLHEVLAGTADVREAVHEGPHGMAVIPGSTDLDAFAGADPEALEPVIEELRDRYEYVILDTGAGLSNDTVVPLTYVDEALLVSLPTRDALGDTDKTRQVADRLGVTVSGAALTRADPSAASDDAVVELLDAAVLSTIPDAAVVSEAAEAGEPLTTFAPGSEAAAAFRSLAAALTGESVESDAAPEPEAASESPDESEQPSEDTTEEAEAEADPANTGTDAASTDPLGEPSSTSDPGPVVEEEEDIVVAGTHEEDLPPEALGSADANAETDDPAADAPGEGAADSGDDGETDGEPPEAPSGPAGGASGTEPTDGEEAAPEPVDSDDGEAVVDEGAEESAADADEGVGAIDAAAESSVDADAPDDGEPLVEHADPDEVVAADPDAERTGDGVYTTSLEDAAAPASPDDASDAAAPDDEPSADVDIPATDAADTGEETAGAADSDADFESQDDDADDEEKKGLFSRFFG